MSALPEPTATELWVQLEQAKRDAALAKMLGEIAQNALVKARAERDAFEAEAKVLRSQLEAVRAVIGGVQ
ncbi:MAG TPA: hypothetical protein VGD87_06050 [Archangium sp.]